MGFSQHLKDLMADCRALFEFKAENDGEEPEMYR